MSNKLSTEVIFERKISSIEKNYDLFFFNRYISVITRSIQSVSDCDDGLLSFLRPLFFTFASFTHEFLLCLCTTGYSVSSSGELRFS